MISIIIPVFNQLTMTKECIESVKKHTKEYEHEIILIDNGSVPAFDAHDSVDKVIANKENLGFPAAINQGMRVASGDIICLLNNDIIVTPEWMDRLLNGLDEYDIVGPMTGYVAGTQHVKTEIYNNEEELNKIAAEWSKKYDGQIKPVNFIIGFCMVFKKSLAEELSWMEDDEQKYFDDSLWPCSGEEVNFCLEAVKAGYKVGVVKDVYIHHYGSATFTDMQREGILDYVKVCKKSDAHLAKKWGNDFWTKQCDVEEEIVGVCLNLGCGYTKLPEPFINIDNRKEVKPDLVCDVLEGLPYKDNSVDMVMANDFLEHIPIGKTIQVVTEIWRVLKPGGKFESLTPSTDGRGWAMDPTHVSFWNKCSWLYYSDDRYRKLYDIKAKFDFDFIKDIEINPGLGIIHTHAVGRTVK